MMRAAQFELIALINHRHSSVDNLFYSFGAFYDGSKFRSPADEWVAPLGMCGSSVTAHFESQNCNFSNHITVVYLMTCNYECGASETGEANVPKCSPVAGLRATETSIETKSD